MKDQLFEFLLNLVEQTLTQLKEKQQVELTPSTDNAVTETVEVAASKEGKVRLELEFIKAARSDTVRVFTPSEQSKLTKASYQFLMRLQKTGLIHSGTMELIINRLLFSDSRYVSLRETKWTIRNTLVDALSSEQLIFLELILYQKEDGVALH